MYLNSHNYKVKKQRTQKSENILPIILFPPISLSTTIIELSKRVLMVLDQLLHYIHYLSIPLVTNSWSDIIRTLFENSPVLLCGPKKKHIEEIVGGGAFPAKHLHIICYWSLPCLSGQMQWRRSNQIQALDRHKKHQET